MKLNKYLLIAILTFSVPAFAGAIKYTTYANGAAEYSLVVPLEVLYAQGESDDHRGQIFKSADNQAKLLTYGAANFNDQSIDELYQDALKPENRDELVFTYKNLGTNWFVVSGFHKDKVFYKKVILSASSNLALTFDFEYPKAQKALYDEMTAKMSKSFKEL